MAEPTPSADTTTTGSGEAKAPAAVAPAELSPPSALPESGMPEGLVAAITPSAANVVGQKHPNASASRAALPQPPRANDAVAAVEDESQQQQQKELDATANASSSSSEDENGEHRAKQDKSDKRRAKKARHGKSRGGDPGADAMAKEQNGAAQLGDPNLADYELEADEEEEGSNPSDFGSDTEQNLHDIVGEETEKTAEDLVADEKREERRTNHNKRTEALLARRSHLYFVRSDEHEDTKPHAMIDTGRDDGEADAQRVFVPKAQVPLSEAALEEDVTKILQDHNPEQPGELVRFNYKAMSYEAVQRDKDNLLVHFYDECRIRRLDTEEGQRLHKQHKLRELRGPKKYFSAFKYNDRAAQTGLLITKDSEAQTEPPPLIRFSENVSQWELFDHYRHDTERKQREANQAKAAPAAAGGGGATPAPQQSSNPEKAPGGGGGDDELVLRRKVRDTIEQASQAAPGGSSGGNELARMSNVLRKMERIVNQNAYEDVALDFKYWEDKSDLVKDAEGSLLPLWEIKYDKSHMIPVNCILWHPVYHDMFIVGHGPNQYLAEIQNPPLPGMVCWYTLKNPSHPEFVFHCESGVRCIDIHPKRSFCLAIGHQDGSVAFWNMGVSLKQPVLKSDVYSGRHLEPVWQIRFVKDDYEGFPKFYSVSADGRITEWNLFKNQLNHRDLYLVNFKNFPKTNPSDPLLQRCTYLIYYRNDPMQYLVGTESGHIMRCCLDRAERIMFCWHAHERAVNRLRWNQYHNNVFLSCSDDWFVKVWDDRCLHKGPVFKFDLRVPVQDVAWAPYSSTILAAALSNSKIMVFDISVDTSYPVCVQSVNRCVPEILQTMVFNPVHPIILTGDDHGQVLSFKLSPNLRKCCATDGLSTLAYERKKAANPTSVVKGGKKGAEKQVQKSKAQEEIDKLEKIMSMIWEPED